MEFKQEAIEKFKETISQFVRSITEAFNNIINWIQGHWKLIKEYWSKLKADGSTHSEIAEIPRIPKGAVDVTIKRIKEKIKAEGWFML